MTTSTTTPEPAHVLSASDVLRSLSMDTSGYAEELGSVSEPPGFWAALFDSPCTAEELQRVARDECAAIDDETAHELTTCAGAVLVIDSAGFASATLCADADELASTWAEWVALDAESHEPECECDTCAADDEECAEHERPPIELDELQRFGSIMRAR